MKRAVVISAMLAIAGNAAAQASSRPQTVGSWTYAQSEPFFAATTNDSGGAFGQWCDMDQRQCFYLVATSTSCEEGASTPVLVNADNTAMSITIICRGLLKDRKLYRYVFADFDQIDMLVRRSKRIGIAIPLEGDEFRVVRFSLAGASVSIDAMLAAADASATKTDRRTTRDQRL